MIAAGARILGLAATYYERSREHGRRRVGGQSAALRTEYGRPALGPDRAP